MVLGNLVRMRVALPIVVGDASATRLFPAAMGRHPPHSRECWRKQAPQITIITFKQVLPSTLVQCQDSIIDIS